MKNIAEYEEILENRATMAKVIIQELTAYKEAVCEERAERWLTT